MATRTPRQQSGQVTEAVEHEGIAIADRQMAMLRAAAALLAARADYVRDQAAQDAVEVIAEALHQSQQMRSRFESVYGEV